MLSGESKRATIDSEGILRFDGHICVSRVGDLIRSILREAHNSRYSIHPGTAKIYRDLRQHCWWSGMKRDLADFVAHRLCCQVKVKHQRPDDLIQRLLIPEWK